MRDRKIELGPPIISDEWAERWIDPEFRARTRANIEEADRDARELAGLGPPIERPAPPAPEPEPAPPPPPPSPPRPKPKPPSPRKAGVCVGCGCPLDDETPGCRNCRSRHSMRRRLRKRRSARKYPWLAQRA
jgi:hypothetical protein